MMGGPPRFSPMSRRLDLFRDRLLFTASLLWMNAWSVAYAPIARADESPARVALSWDAPAECIDESRLKSAVEAMLEHSVWAPRESADVEVEASLVREERDWVLRMTLRTGSTLFGTREVHRGAQSCRSIDGVIVVVLALLVDLPRRDILLRVPADDDEAPPPVLDMPDDAPPSLSEVPEVRLGAGASFDVGTLPQPAFGGELSLYLSPAQLWPFFRVSGRALAPSDTPLDSSGGGAHIWLFGGSLGVCPEATLDVFIFGSCAGVGVDGLVGSGLGLEDVHEAIGIRWSAQVSGVVAVRLGFFDLRLEAGVVFTLSRDSFVRDRGSMVEQVLHEPAWVAFGANLGMIFRLAP